MPDFPKQCQPIIAPTVVPLPNVQISCDVKKTLDGSCEGHGVTNSGVYENIYWTNNFPSFCPVLMSTVYMTKEIND